MEANGRDEFLADLWTWQVQVRRTLEHLDRLLSRLPVPFSMDQGALALPVPRRDPPVGHREPDVDLVQGLGGVSVTLEMPGAERDEVDLTVTEELLVVRVDTPRRRYYREVPLPPGLDLGRVEATYRHGVLDVTIARREGG